MEQKTPFKELTFSQKIQYIWDYYKIPIFLVIIGIIAVTTFICGRLAQKNTVLSVLCVNAENSTTEDNGADIFNDFLTDNGYDLSKDEIALNKNICVDVDKSGLDYQNMAVLTAYFASNEYDICFMDDKTFDYYAKNVCFEDISKYLDKAVLEKYKDRLAYVTIDGKEYPCGIRLSARCYGQKIMRLHITVAAFLFLLLLSYEFLLFLSFRIPPIARSTTLRHETINKSGT